MWQRSSIEDLAQAVLPLGGLGGHKGQIGATKAHSSSMVDLTMALFARFWGNGNQDELLSSLHT
jgi:hypothetical protein